MNDERTNHLYIIIYYSYDQTSEKKNGQKEKDNFMNSNWLIM